MTPANPTPEDRLMDEQAHTAGPWFWALDKHNQPTSLMRSGSGDYVVCPQSEQSNYGLSSHEWNDVSEADARLIAAAPDLLGAASALAAPDCIYDGPNIVIPCADHGEALRLMSALRAAILRATGEA